METALSLKSVDDKEQALNELLDAVLNKHLQPEDLYEIAAILESMGLNDERVAERFGVEDVFELAQILWQKMQQKILFTPFAKVQQYTLTEIIIELSRNFLRGVIFALPMALSVLSMLTLRFSLWSYENLSVELATSIGVGTVLSFITVGGFTQAIARRGFFYVIQGYYNMARRVTFYFIFWGFVVCIIICIFLYIFNMFIQVLPFDLLTIAILYYFFLNAIWLSVTVMYILKKELTFTGLLLAGIGIVYVITAIFGIDKIIVAQLVSLLIVSVISLALVVYYFKKAEQKGEKGIAPKLPKMSVTIYSTLPYFVYGALYFTFLYVDRILAWSTHDKNYMPFFILFRGYYELGLDFALLVLIIPMGMSEVILNKLMNDIQTSQKAFWAYESENMNRLYVKQYWKRMILVSLIAILSAVFVFLITHYVTTRFPSDVGRILISDPLTRSVFLWALVAYVFVAIALMNAVILFSLSQPKLAIQAIWPAMVLNIVVGFLCTRWWGYEFAVVGLITGSLVFLVISSKNVVRVLRNLDYYLYVAS
ncbi:exopolysaccharide Pel transporter PelG [Paenibacillus sp. GCM10027628]|uniref:exopolysaccharide Pel transporter PelG n=1 Tax=Paenibacillus sp. GCM10027628 TaxID=3273413 RepID=UPI00362857C9